MSQSESESKVTMACPQGHRVRGGAGLIGKNVRCPKCQTEFLFAGMAKATASSRVTDTGVMRILGDMRFDEPQESVDEQVSMRPCTRCGVAIPESLSVCSHCDCYVGVLPSFMRQMGADMPQQNQR